MAIKLIVRVCLFFNYTIIGSLFLASAFLQRIVWVTVNYKLPSISLSKYLSFSASVN
jgi:hypothetical protein